MGLTLDPVKYGQIPTAELPRKIESDEEYDRWADRIEAIDFSAHASPEERVFAASTSTDAAPDAVYGYWLKATISRRKIWQGYWG